MRRIALLCATSLGCSYDLDALRNDAALRDRPNAVMDTPVVMDSGPPPPPWGLCSSWPVRKPDEATSPLSPKPRRKRKLPFRTKTRKSF